MGSPKMGVLLYFAVFYVRVDSRYLIAVYPSNSSFNHVYPPYM